MSGSSEYELKQLLRSLGLTSSFIGIYDCRFPGFLNPDKRQTAIVNTGPRESGGLHWIALAFDPIGYKFYLFDPLGWKERDLSRFYNFSYKQMLERSALNTPTRCVTLVKNEEAVQCTCSGSCGLFSVLFLYCFKHYPFNPYHSPLMKKLQGSVAALYPVRHRQLHENQRILYEFLEACSRYFVRNKNHIVRNTNVGLIKTHI